MDDQIYTAPSGFTIQGYDNLVNESRHGSTSIQIAPGNKTMTVHAEAEGHICFEHSGVCVDCPDEIEKFTGYARRQVQVNLRSEERDRKIGEEEVLLLTTRGLCCCPKDGPIFKDPLVTGTFAIPERYNPQRLDPAAAAEHAHDAYAGSFYHTGGAPQSPKSDLQSARGSHAAASASYDRKGGDDCACHKNNGAPETATAAADLSGRMTIRQANGMLGFIKEQMIKTVETVNPLDKPLPFYQTDLFAQQLRSVLIRTRRSRKISGQPLNKAVKVKVVGEAIAKHLEIKPGEVMVRDVFSQRDEDLARMTGGDIDDIVAFKMQLMGVKMTGKPGSNGEGEKKTTTGKMSDRPRKALEERPWKTLPCCVSITVPTGFL